MKKIGELSCIVSRVGTVEQKKETQALSTAVDRKECSKQVGMEAFSGSSEDCLFL